MPNQIGKIEIVVLDNGRCPTQVQGMDDQRTVNILISVAAFIARKVEKSRGIGSDLIITNLS